MTRPDHPTPLRILRAAEILFAEHGFSGVSMRDIAAAAEVNLGGLPYHFGTKDALYRAIWQYWISKTEASQSIDDAIRQPATSPEEKLRTMVEAFYGGPASLLGDPHGKHFVAILVREANDPASAERGLLREFIYPSGKLFRQEFERILPKMPADAMEVAFEMMISGLRIVIERRQPSSTDAPGLDKSNRLFWLVTNFVVDGWLSLCQRDNG